MSTSQSELFPEASPPASAGAATAPALAFTARDSMAAHRVWGANCGPHAIAAACDLSLDAVRAVLPAFKGWMNPTMVGEALRALNRSYSLRKGLKTLDLCEGVNRVQWEGPWLAPGRPVAEAYRHTHWVAQRRGWVLCSACAPWEWVRADEWAPFLRANGQPFHITHHYQF